uniref:Nucleotide-diphospho-sugar transferase domain-containing protein n=2 Tax=Parascaris univalens TaxID=6257 RepID=A0A914ZG60_PARUN
RLHPSYWFYGDNDIPRKISSDLPLSGMLLMIVERIIFKKCILEITTQGGNPGDSYTDEGYGNGHVNVLSAALKWTRKRLIMMFYMWRSAKLPYM